MWKKALWVYLGLYVLGMLVVLVSQEIKMGLAGELQPATVIASLFVFIPAAVLFFDLRGKRVSIWLTLLGLLIVAVPVVGIFNFNTMSLATVGKALIFLPMIAGLIYYAIKRPPKE